MQRLLLLSTSLCLSLSFLANAGKPSASSASSLHESEFEDISEEVKKDFGVSVKSKTKEDSKTSKQVSTENIYDVSVFKQKIRDAKVYVEEALKPLNAEFSALDAEIEAEAREIVKRNPPRKTGILHTIKSALWQVDHSAEALHEEKIKLRKNQANQNRRIHFIANFHAHYAKRMQSKIRSMGDFSKAPPQELEKFCENLARWTALMRALESRIKKEVTDSEDTKKAVLGSINELHDTIVGSYVDIIKGKSAKILTDAIGVSLEKTSKSVLTHSSSGPEIPQTPKNPPPKADEEGERDYKHPSGTEKNASMGNDEEWMRTLENMGEKVGSGTADESRESSVAPNHSTDEEDENAMKLELSASKISSRRPSVLPEGSNDVFESEDEEIEEHKDSPRTVSRQSSVAEGTGRRGSLASQRSLDRGDSYQSEGRRRMKHQSPPRQESVDADEDRESVSVPPRRDSIALSREARAVIKEDLQTLVDMKEEAYQRLLAFKDSLTKSQLNDSRRVFMGLNSIKSSLDAFDKEVNIPFWKSLESEFVDDQERVRFRRLLSQVKNFVELLNQYSGEYYIDDSHNEIVDEKTNIRISLTAGGRFEREVYSRLPSTEANRSKGYKDHSPNINGYGEEVFE